MKTAFNITLILVATLLAQSSFARTYQFNDSNQPAFDAHLGDNQAAERKVLKPKVIGSLLVVQSIDIKDDKTIIAHVMFSNRCFAARTSEQLSIYRKGNVFSIVESATARNAGVACPMIYQPTIVDVEVGQLMDTEEMVQINGTFESQSPGIITN